MVPLAIFLCLVVEVTFNGHFYLIARFSKSGFLYIFFGMFHLLLTTKYAKLETCKVFLNILYM